MQFTRQGDLVRVLHVTGPTHNLLGLQLVNEPAEPEIEELIIPGPRLLTSSDVQREVCAGVASANAELGSRFAARRIQFVPSDSAPAGIYRELAAAIVRHVAKSVTDAAGQAAA
jgi:hypothetical protein